MLPLYAVRIENLGQGEFVKVDCAACHHVALLTPGALFRVKMSPAAEVLDSRGGSGAAGADRAAVLPWRPAVRRVGAAKYIQPASRVQLRCPPGRQAHCGLWQRGGAPRTPS